MGGTRPLFLCLPFLLALLVGLCTVAAQPVMPAIVRGEVTINGAPAPVGTTVSARMDGKEAESFQVSKEGSYILTIEGSLDDTNKTIEFYVNGIKSDAEARWLSGGLQSVNLDVKQPGNEYLFVILIIAVLAVILYWLKYKYK
jgi:hypothetical protein